MASALPNSPPTLDKPGSTVTGNESEKKNKAQELNQQIDMQLELQSLLDELIATNTTEIRKITKKTPDSFEMAMKFLCRVMEDEEEGLGRVLAQIQEIVSNEFGLRASQPRKAEPEAGTHGQGASDTETRATKLKLVRSASTVGRMFQFFTGMPVKKEELEAEEDSGADDGHDRASDSDLSSTKANLVPAFMLLASLVKELKRLNNTFEGLSANVAKILEEQKNISVATKGQFHVAREALDLKKEKIRLMRHNAKGRGGSDGGGGIKMQGSGGAGARSGPASGSGFGLFKPCSSL